MIDADTLVDALVKALQSNSDLVSALGDQTKIVGYKDSYPGASDWGTAAKTLLVAPPYAIARWRDTRAGRQGRYTSYQAIMHEMSVYLRPLGSLGMAWYALREGIVSTTGLKFKLSAVHPSCHPPGADGMNALERSIATSDTSALDFLEIQLTLTERGVDD